MTSHEYIAKLLKIEPSVLRVLDESVVERVREELGAKKEEMHAKFDGTGHLRHALQQEVLRHEKELLKFIGERPDGGDHFGRAVAMAKEIAKTGRGFFLKKSHGQEILRQRPPQHLLEFLGYRTVDELFAKHDVTEAFSALRFMESQEWMHETFEQAYSRFTADDFEERDVEIRVLGEEWKEVAAQFVAKKHHNVSHLKEFGVIFLNPIAEDAPGKFLRDFALLFHYSHEVEFYSKLFKMYSAHADFAAKLKSLLRGDVRQVTSAAAGEWLIVQRYLFKENPQDPRLFVPHVNPESMHWARGERDLAAFGKKHNLSIQLWGDLDWAGEVDETSGQIVSYDMEDNLMSAVEIAAEGSRGHSLNYHQHEALWTKLFMEQAGGEKQMEKLLTDYFVEGVIPKR